MAIQRLDNKRPATSAGEEEVPTLSVGKSGAVFSDAATRLMQVTPGSSFLGFGWDDEKECYVFWKAVEEKDGKKLSVDSKIVARGIYSRLNEGATYVVGVPFTEGETTYFPLQEGTSEVPATKEEATSQGYTPVVGEAYEQKYGSSGNSYDMGSVSSASAADFL